MNRMSRILNLALLLAVAAFGGASTAAPLQQVEVFVARQGGYHSLRASAASASLPQTPVPRAQLGFSGSGGAFNCFLRWCRATNLSVNT